MIVVPVPMHGTMITVATKFLTQDYAQGWIWILSNNPVE